MKNILILLITLFPLCANAQKNQQKQLRKIVEEYLHRYTSPYSRIAPTKLTKLSIDQGSKTLEIYVTKGMQELYYTEGTADSIYESLRDTLPKPYKSYSLRIIADKHPIEELVANTMRRRTPLAEERLARVEYKGQAWVRNTSQPYTATKGLAGRHIALWQSHGNYYSEKKSRWEWQRPYLFCTTEDLFTQTFVVPFIYPMLENAGAVVYTPRERDWQSNEVIIDNDQPHKGGSYIETDLSGSNTWQTSPQAAFAHLKDVYHQGDHPFSDGTARYVSTTKKPSATATAYWMPEIPESGRYAVYVSYQSFVQSVTDARYTVHHKGGQTEFCVNQQMGGGIWVYLGTFEFDKGMSEQAMVTLTNRSNNKGVVSADAVRFGGGMGNIARGDTPTATVTSGLPRWAEGALYNLHWSGMPDSVTYARYDGNDYRNDINSRSYAVNYLSGGSVYNPNWGGLRVPIDMSLGVHSDAGYKDSTEIVGTLTICNTAFNEGETPTGTSRFTSRDLTATLLHNLNRDLADYPWQVRSIWNRDYSEAREPFCPSAILEMLSHQNWTDMCYGHDPRFKFRFSRSVYKSIVKYLATYYNKEYVIQPLPVNSFAIELDEAKRKARLSWQPTKDHLEPTAKAERYILYTRIGDGAFDNGQIVDKEHCTVNLQPGTLYSFRIAPLNDGGAGFPSETLCAYITPQKSKGTILIVNAFDRLEGPAQVNTTALQGFDIERDPGVPYGLFPGYCGNQLAFDRTTIGKVTPDGLGYSASNLEGKLIMGNTFDYPAIHGRAIQAAGKYSFASTSERALREKHIDLSPYTAIDIIYGVQKEFHPTTGALLEDYHRRGGRLLVSGANMLHSPQFSSPCLGVTGGKKITDKTIDHINGLGLSFTIHRQLNSESYSVPAPHSLMATHNTVTPLLNYAGGETAAVLNSPSKGTRSVTLGFPFESITDHRQRNILMGYLLQLLME